MGAAHRDVPEAAFGALRSVALSGPLNLGPPMC